MIFKKEKPWAEEKIGFLKTIAILEGKIVGLEAKLESMEDRGDRHSSARDAAEKRLAELQKTFVEMFMEPTKLAAYKEAFTNKEREKSK